ncbi:MAG: POTRA domain-containing protein [Kosmotogaceae bacterium]
MSIRRLFLIIALVLTYAFAAASMIPSRITILDNKVISDNEVLGMLNIQRGKEISDSEMREALERVKGSGYFSDVYYSFDESSSLLSIQVKEYPVVDVEVSFDGPKIVEESVLEAVSVIKSGKPMNPSRLMHDIPLTLDAIEAELRENGYIEPFVKVDWETDKSRSDIFSGNISDRVKVTFIVRVSFLWELSIDAPISDEAKSYLADKLQIDYLKKYYDTSVLIRWINSKKKYVPRIEDINAVVQTIYSTYYANPNGQWGLDDLTYQAMIVTLNNALKSVRQVTLPEEVKESNALSMSITFTPVEYVKSEFNLRSVFVEGNVNLQKGEILRETGLIEGQKVNNEVATKAIQAVQDLYSDSGYPFMRIEPAIDEKIGFFSLKITEPLVRDVTVEFDGPKKTQDYLISEKIVIEKGKVLSLDELRNTYAFLNNTGYFSKVDIVPVPVGTDALDVKIRLEETDKNNRIGGGGGWQNGLNLYLDLGLLNVWGYGQKILTTLSVTLPMPNNKEVVITNGATETTTRRPAFDATIGYSIPKVAGSRLDLDTAFKLKLTGFNTTVDSTDTLVEKSSQETEFMFSLTPIYNISPGQKVGFTAGYEYLMSESQVSTETKASTGTETGRVSESFDGLFTGVSYELSTRDDLMRPTMGSEYLAGLNVRGIFGKENKLFVSGYAEYRNFMSIGDPVLGFRIRTQQLFPLSPHGVFRNYLLSPDTFIRIRGSQSIGQNVYGVTVGSAQLRYPLTPETSSIPVDIVGFGDLLFYRNTSGGDVIGGNFLADFGLCVDISIPMIGLIRLGYGYNTYLADQSSTSGKPYYGTPFFGFGPAF